MQSPFFYSPLDVCKEFFNLNLARLRVVASLIVGESRHLPWTQENRIVNFCILSLFAIEPLSRFVSATAIVAIEPALFNLAWS